MARSASTPESRGETFRATQPLIDLREQKSIILLVEDDPDDAFLLRHAAHKAGVTHDVVVLKDGQELIEYVGALLAAFPTATDLRLPALLLLDIHLPRKDGFQVLAWLKMRPELAAMPVIAISGTMDTAKAKMARHLGAADTLEKCLVFEHLVAVVADLRQRYLT